LNVSSLSIRSSNDQRADRQLSSIFWSNLVGKEVWRSRQPSFDKPAEGDTTMRFNRLLWIVQGVLAVVCLFTGGMKLVLPLEELVAPIPLPGPFLRFL
jgi:hypothetical protein